MQTPGEQLPIMFAFSMVIIAAFAGTIDLGQQIFKALSETNIGKGVVLGLCVPASCITFLSEQAFAPQNTRFWSRRRVWFQFTVGEDKAPMLSVDNRGKGVLSMDCSAKRSPL